METLIKQFDQLDDKNKKRVITYFYHKKCLSWNEVAKLAGTYAQKIRREAIRLGLQSRDKSQAQKAALASGRSEHRTEGKKRTEKTKEKISKKMGAVWESLTDEEMEKRRQTSRTTWDNMTDEQKEYNRIKCIEGLRKASQHGSKLEIYLLQELTRYGYKIDFHKEHLLRNIKLHIDLLIPTLRTAIEVDGPSHFLPIWGEERLQKVQKSDREKTGLILSEGLCLIRIKQIQSSISQLFMRNILGEVLDVLYAIEEEFPPENQRLFLL